MSTPETILGLRWLNSVLSADTTLQGLAPGGVWLDLAPPGTSYPFVILALQSGTDVTTANGVRLMSTPLYQVKVVGPASSTDTIAQAAAQADTVLGGLSGTRNVTVTDGYILSCVRESPLQQGELINGIPYVNLGGLYRLHIEQR